MTESTKARTNLRQQTRTARARRRRHATALGLVAICGAVLAAGCSGGGFGPTTDSTDQGETRPGTIRMNSTGSSEELVMWIAEAEGIFERNGLDVQISDVAGAGLTPIALTNGEIDLGIQTAPDFLQATAQGLPLTIAAGLSVNNPDNPRLFVVAGRDSGIQSAGDLANARIGTPSRGGSFEVSTVALLREQGVDPSGIEWVEVPFAQMAESLASGVVDAVATSVTLRGRLLAEQHRIVLDLSEFGDDVLVTFLSTTREWAGQHPGDLDRLRTSLEEAAAFAEANPERAAAIAAERTGLPADVVARIPLPNSRVDVRAEQIQRWIDAMTEQGRLDGAVDPTELMTP